MSLLRRNRASDELDEAAVAGKKHLALTAVTCLSSRRSGVMTPRTHTDTATGMTSFPSVSDTSPPGIRSRLLLVPVQIRLVGIQLQSVG